MTNNTHNNDVQPSKSIFCQHEDEISLYDLWKILVRRKWIIFLSTIAFFAFSLIYAFSQEPVYTYNVVIQSGSTFRNGDQQVIESPQTSVSKLNQTYIPTVLSDWRQEYKPFELPELKASVPDNSDSLILISGKGPIASREIHFDLLTAISARLQQDHKRAQEVEKDRLLLKIKLAENTLNSHRGNLSELQAREKRLEVREDLLKQEMADFEEILKSAEANQRQAVGTLNGEAEAMTLLMLSSEIRATRARISHLREEVHISLADRRDSLKKQIADTIGTIEAQEVKVATLRRSLQNMFETSLLSPPQQSLHPTNPNPTMLTALGLMLGLLVGVSGAFLVDFIQNARSHGRPKPDA